MKSKILVGALAVMIAAGSLVGCNAMKEGVDEVMPSTTAPNTTGTTTEKPSAQNETDKNTDKNTDNVQNQAETQKQDANSAISE